MSNPEKDVLRNSKSEQVHETKHAESTTADKLRMDSHIPAPEKQTDKVVMKDAGDSVQADPLVLAQSLARIGQLMRSLPEEYQKSVMENNKGVLSHEFLAIVDPNNEKIAKAFMAAIEKA